MAWIPGAQCYYQTGFRERRVGTGIMAAIDIILSCPLFRNFLMEHIIMD